MNENPLRLRVSGYARSKLVKSRSERDHQEILNTIVSLVKIQAQHKHNHRLVSSIHGAIKTILLTLPPWIFFPKEKPKEVGIIEKYTTAFEAIISTLPLDTEIIILTHKRTEARLYQWLEKFGVEDRTAAVFAEDNLSFTMWAEDAFCICKEVNGKQSVFIEPLHFNRADDKEIADMLALTRPHWEQREVPLYFQGGNILIGDDFWFIGGDYLQESINLGLVKPTNNSPSLEIIKKVFSKYIDDTRELITIKSQFSIPEESIRCIKINGELWSEILYRGNKPNTIQPLFHIDMFLSLAGKNKNGIYTILVGDPKMASQLLGEELPEGAMQETFDDIAMQLLAKGFNVIRNPMPLIYDDDDVEKIRYWYFATGNNVIVQDTPKIVWLPTYGYDEWENLSITDNKNKEIWEALGYEVKMLPNFHPFAAKLGAAHCITKYIARQDENLLS